MKYLLYDLWEASLTNISKYITIRLTFLFLQKISIWLLILVNLLSILILLSKKGVNIILIGGGVNHI